MRERAKRITLARHISLRRAIAGASKAADHPGNRTVGEIIAWARHSKMQISYGKIRYSEGVKIAKTYPVSSGQLPTIQGLSGALED